MTDIYASEPNADTLSDYVHWRQVYESSLQDDKPNWRAWEKMNRIESSYAPEYWRLFEDSWQDHLENLESDNS